MALFQLRKARDDQAAAAVPAQTVEAIRRRAVHRLIGAAVLVVAGVIGFPLVFDNQPRPIPVDLPISIPDKNKMPPLATPPAALPSTLASAPASARAVAVPVAPAPATEVAAVQPIKPAASVAPAAQPAVKPAAQAEAKPDPKAEDARKAKALLEGREVAGQTASSAAAQASERYVVQVGAFSDAAKVREVRQKVEGAGLKTYTQVVETKDGQRTRVRVGPFADKAEAERAADKIRKLDLPVVLLGL